MRLLIRADASTSIGSGHFMRCLALAQGWQAHSGSVTFLSRCESGSLRRGIESLGIRFIPLEKAHPQPLDLQTTLLTLERLETPWLVLDGYQFDPTYQQAIQAAGYQLVVIDDMARHQRCYADVLLNQNIYAERLNYHCDSNTMLLLGTRYALLRREFLPWSGWQREIPKVARRVLVTMGGSDPDNVTGKIIRALCQLDISDLEVIVVIGAINLHHDELVTLSSATREKYGSHISIKLVRNASNMPELMAWANAAVSAAGTTCWELAFMGLPSFVLVLAENQKGIADGLDEAGVAVNLGCPEQLSIGYMKEVIISLLESPAERQKMSRLGRALVDGGGTDRVVEILHLQSNAVRLDDAHTIPWQ